MNKLLTSFISTIFFMIISSNVIAQSTTPAVTEEDYARAESFLSATTSKLVQGLRISPNWLENDQFWYRKADPEGHSFVIVDPKKSDLTPAFNHEKVAKALSEATGDSYTANKLPFNQFKYMNDGKSIAFEVKSEKYQCDVDGKNCKSLGLRDSRDRFSIVSPDGTKIAFIRDNNLWLRLISTNKETQLTNDGIEDFGYATNNAGWTKSDRPVLLWSPDSKMIATFQHDGRGVGEMHLTSTKVGHPTLHSWKYPLPEDTVIFRIHRVVIHVDAPRVVRLQMPPDQHRSSICDHITCRGGGFADIEWSKDSRQLAFASNTRDHKQITLRVANPETGAVRDVLEEKVDTFFESGYNMVNWHVLKQSNEVIWFSQRDNWGHLYLYDLESGQLKNQITKGGWNVLQVLRIDEDSRTIYFLGSGKEEGNPYYKYLYSVGMDATGQVQQPESDIQFGGVRVLTPEFGDHTVSISPSGKHFVDSRSTPDTPPVHVLRNSVGQSVQNVESADISKLLEAGWVAPETFAVKARDGVTDLYGTLFKPSNFDPSKKYPIINYIYPGPQSGSVRGWGFSPSRADNQAIAELGFIVVAINAMGTPGRSKSFHATYYGNMGDNGLPDQIAGMKQLAEKYSWIDINRVGIYGHSGGGFASTDAILRYPEFFKVAVSGAGNHDNRNYEDDWGEKWQGLLKTNADGSTTYDNQANQLLAKNLKGKLLITHGTMDTNVPFYNTLLVVNALIAANKDFDLMLFPNRGHGFGNEPYMMRLRWDYFVRHLLGAEPPKEFTFKTNTSMR